MTISDFANADVPMPTLERLLKACGEAQLTAALAILQQRLGKPAERSGDLERVQLIAHQLNNLRTAHVLIEELGTEPPL